MSVVIKQIDRGTVNKICSGQVILCLATAVKELIENSLDANATTIQIRLKEFGSQTIEVSDNGSGVDEANFEALTLKHYTSKISDFSDLSGVQTFGFRGEALSSLCSVSNVTILTRHKSVAYGTRLVLDHDGNISEKTKVARQIGTTVILENIFYTLPVRHKEFMRNLRKEFTKMCNVVYAYGLQSCGVCISITNIANGKKTTVMETTGESVKSNISAIFGPKQSLNLLEVCDVAPSAAILDEYSLKDDGLLKVFQLSGFISCCSHGSGRSSGDRQFYFINSRPVDNTKVTKLVNDIYHQYNPHQYPFIVLNVNVNLNTVDVNLTPDKRQILIENEKLLLATLKATLLDIYKDIPASIPVQAVDLQTFVQTPVQGGSVKLDKFRSLTPLLTNKSMSTPSSSIKETINQANLDGFIQKSSSVLSYQTETEPVLAETILSKSKVKEGEVMAVPVATTEVIAKDKSVSLETKNSGFEATARVTEIVETTNKDYVGSLKKKVDDEEKAKRKHDPGECKNNKKLKLDPVVSRTPPTTVSCAVTVSRIQNLLQATRLSECETQKHTVKFLAQINPSTNDKAEDELKKELSKESFKQMNVIGQFNLGFIITKLKSDLFLVDQHATDEKFNFEQLQQTTVIQNQRLIVPQPLELTMDKELLLLDHSDVIRKNGFEFTFDPDAGPNRRIKLTSIPFSKNWVFGKADIDELLFMLEDAPLGKMCRPSRIRDMFASRACRKSVMIGTALNMFEMRRLVDHMGDMDHPWNCPHGRPTIRHLLNLDMITQTL